MTKTPVSTLILAAGLGTRMKSTRAKVLHTVLFEPMIHHVVQTVNAAGFDNVFVIVGHQKEEVMAVLDDFQASFVVQEEQLGTGHAVLCAESQLQAIGGTVMILNGDVPLISRDSIEQMLAKHQERDPALTVMTTLLEDPANYGRILRNEQGQLLAIVEEKDASVDQKKIKEINAGIYCAAVPFLFEALRMVGTDNSQGEVYLTDIVEIAIDMGREVDIFSGTTAEEVLGVNSKSELAAANKYLQARQNNKLMAEGVTLSDPETIFVQQGVHIGSDTSINPNVQITGQTVIGSNCTIGPDVILHDCQIGDNAVISPFSNLSGCRIGESETVKPHTTISKD